MRKIFSLFCLFVSICLIGCKKGEPKELFTYEERPLETVKDIEYDDLMTIDGLANESVYEGMDVLSFVETQSGIKLESKAFLGEKGIYLYAIVYDTNVYVSSEKEFYQNDSVEFYLDPNPEYSKTLEHLNSGLKVRSECVQLRINALGEHQTWYGRKLGAEENAYPWAAGYFDAVACAHVEGEINEKQGAQNYSVEAFIPYYEMQLDSKPETIGLLVAFNNVENREDTSRTWFAVKGMGHGSLTSYAMVKESGFVIEEILPQETLTADYNDNRYKDCQEIVMYEVDENNENETARAKFKAYLGEDGLYATVLVKDKVRTYLLDNIFSNDGIELVVDTREEHAGAFHQDGIYRYSFDLAGGTQYDYCKTGYNDYVSQFAHLNVKTKVENITDTSIFNYKYEYTYEVMIPYELMGLDAKPESLSFAFAVKTPNERAYILNRTNGAGVAEDQDWLWIDQHYPQNPGEYFILTDGSSNLVSFNWKEWDELTIHSASKERYDYQGYATDDGVYIKMLQHVNSYVSGGVGGNWLENTHIEMELFNHGVGYGWDGTYFAFFMNGSFYANNRKNITSILNKVSVAENDGSQPYRYTITYEIYIGFPNNVDSADGPYAYIEFMSYTPGEDATGYDNSILITKDGNRVLWKDDCNSHGLFADGITAVDYKPHGANEVLSYENVEGTSKVINKKITSTSLGNIYILTNKEIGSTTTFTSMVMAGSKGKAGVVFAYSDSDNYYYFYVDGNQWTVNLVKVYAGVEEVVYSNYLSASYQQKNGFKFTIEIKNNKYYCSFFNTLYTQGNLELVGKKLGFKTNMAGSQFYDMNVTNTMQNYDVDTLIVGHSLTELWYNYQTDLVMSGISADAKDVGISGSQTVHWLDLIESIITYNPELVIYFNGINDLFFNSATPIKLVENIEQTLVRVHNVKNDVKFAVVSLNYAPNAEYLRDSVTYTNDLLEAMVAKYDWAYYVDIEDAFCDEEGKPIGSYFTDGLHFVDKAYTDIITPKIAESLGVEYSKVTITTDAPKRYSVSGAAINEGIYFRMKQYVNSYVFGSVFDQGWNNTHIEVHLFNHGMGYGWDGTYLAFFMDGTYYLNNDYKVKDLAYHVSVSSNPLDAAYKFTITYEVFIKFDNNLESPQDGPYGYLKMMSMTPGEDTTGYENTTTILKDDYRELWTDHCVSYRFSNDGIVERMQS